MQTITRDNVNAQLFRHPDTALVEVLGPEYYRKFHLPGAINVPLGETFDAEIQEAVPDKKIPVVVYCMDLNCQASSKAAQRMMQLGYEQIFDYEAGKMDWKEAGLPVEEGR